MRTHAVDAAQWISLQLMRFTAAAAAAAAATA